MGNEGAERTEEATPRRRGKEREKGNVSRSKDLESAIAVSLGIVLIALFSGFAFNKLKEILVYTFTNLNPDNLKLDDLISLFGPYFYTYAIIVFPFLIALFVVIVIAVRMEVGPVFSFQKIKPSFNKLSPSTIVNNAKRMLNPLAPRTIVELVKSLLKVGVVGFVGFSVANNRRGELADILGLDVHVGFGIICSILIEMLIKMCIAMLIMGFLDRKYQNYEYEKSIKMTKQEVKDEHKDSEGDPQIKSKIRSIQMQMARQRMMSAVPESNVVVTNPTHYAVALKFDKETNPIPVVTAKGIDFVALKIKEVAINNNVPIVENRPLARKLYDSVPIDGIIPVDMWAAVAEILAYVMRQKGK